MNLKHGITLAVILIAATFLAYTLWQPDKGEKAGVRSLRTAQDADAPDGDPRQVGEALVIPAFDHRLHLFTGADRLRIPRAKRLDFPVGTESGAFTYNAQPFWSLNPQRGGHHTGDDLNGIGGMNSDLGDTVYAIGNGLVIYSGEPDPSWGKTLLIAHRLSDGRIVQSMYSHLQEILVPLNEQVVRGQQVGRIGNAEGQYLAHLHFEMHEANGPSLGAGYLSHRTNRLDPTATVKSNHASASEEIGPSIAEIVAQIQRDNLAIPIGF